MPRAAHVNFSDRLATVCRRAGWKVRRDRGNNLLLTKNGTSYAATIKVASEGRGDRLVPLLAQAVLEAQSAVHNIDGMRPLAVVAAPRVSLPVTEQALHFAARHAPTVAVGVVDAEGLRAFVGDGLAGLNARPAPRPVRGAPEPPRLPSLFSELNQRLLKILLGQVLPEQFITVPRGPFRTATQLARAAGVSVVSASRFVRLLIRESFLDESADHLRIARAEDMLERWAYSVQGAAEEVPTRWLLRQGERQLIEAIRAYSTLRGDRSSPRCCLGLFAAADALGVGVVRGVAPYLYLERLDSSALRQFGLTREGADQRTDVIVRVPAYSQVVFGTASYCDGVPVSDVVQVWLDTVLFPARGREQAGEIRRRALAPLFGKR